MRFLKRIKPWNNMKSIRIYPEDHVDALRILADLWRSTLKKDNWWHYFWEGDFFFVRYQSKFDKGIHKFLMNNNITFSHYKDWKDDHPIVNDHKRYCATVFHANSILTFETIGAYDDKEFDKYKVTLRDLGDRALHSFFNNQAYTIMGNFRDPEVIEMDLTAEISKFRSHYAGIRYWGKQVDKYMTDCEKYTKELVAFYEEKYGESYDKEGPSIPNKETL
jgi:hypothetical protein